MSADHEHLEAGSGRHDGSWKALNEQAQKNEEIIEALRRAEQRYRSYRRDESVIWISEITFALAEFQERCVWREFADDVCLVGMEVMRTGLADASRKGRMKESARAICHLEKRVRCRS